jgi:choline dehydrogenase-like flavoprotein
MIYDAGTAPQTAAGQTLKADICIVGSGAAGLSMAHYLREATDKAGNPLRVVVLESSRVNKLRQVGAQHHRYEDGDVQPIYKGVKVPSGATAAGQASADEFLVASRIRCYGGTTNCWTGWTQPLSSIDFDRSAVHPFYKWPFDKDDLDELESSYHKAMTYCSINNLPVSGYDDPDWWKDVAKENGYDIEALDLKGTALRSRIIIRTGGYGGGKIDGGWDFQFVWGETIEKERGNVDIYRNANVRGIETDVPAGTITRLNITVLKGDSGSPKEGHSFQVQAKRYVLATGCVENTRLMLGAGFRRFSPQLGQGLMTHPRMPVVATFKVKESVPEAIRLFYRFDMALFNGNPIPPNVFAVLVPTDDTLKTEKIGNFRAWVGLGNKKKDKSEEHSDEGTVNFNFEQFPDISNTITTAYPTDNRLFPKDLVPVITMELKEIDRRTRDVGLRLVRKVLEDKGLVQPNTYLDLPTAVEVTGEHAMGTTRMGANPGSGVVDKNCRVFGLDNLFVAGGSVFPTGGWANPTLTIIALGLRLADRLKTSLQ